MRQTTIPKQLQIAEDYPSLVQAIQKIITENQIQELDIVSGEVAQELITENLIKDLEISINYHKNNPKSIKSSSWVLGIGGGRILDLAKFRASELGANFISMPTLIAHDGICSPVAVIDGESKAACMPSALVVPLYIIEKAPLKQIQAGIGDLVANLSAIEDWKLAHQHNNEEIDDFAIMLSKRAAMNILQQLELQIRHCEERSDTAIQTTRVPKEHSEAILRDRKFLKSLIESLALSGIAMSISGNSRPCSGAEHMISHAIDQIHGHGAKAMHGIQVLVATLYLERIRGFDLYDQSPLQEKSRLWQIFEKLNFPLSFEDIDIFKTTDLLELAPKTRKRFSVFALLKK